MSYMVLWIKYLLVMNNFILYLYIYEILFLYFDGLILVSLINCIVVELKLSKKNIFELFCW